MTITAFVHAKRHSERCPGKNLRMLGDRPLFCHAIRIGLEAKRVDRVVIDSEDDEILKIGEEHGAIPLKRPIELATNEATGDDLAYWQAKQVIAEPAMVQIVPTSPFILPSTIDDTLNWFADPAEIRHPIGYHYNTAIGAQQGRFYRWELIPEVEPAARWARACYRTNGPLPNSQALEPMWWETTGLYVMRPAVVYDTHRRIDYSRCRLIPLSYVESINIDTEGDFRFAEIIWRGLHSGLCDSMLDGVAKVMADEALRDMGLEP